jgi:hypothetical protein
LGLEKGFWLLSSELGAHKTVTAGFWPWFSIEGVDLGEVVVRGHGLPCGAEVAAAPGRGFV